jgi:hypothetical protein
MIENLHAFLLIAVILFGGIYTAGLIVEWWIRR